MKVLFLKKMIRMLVIAMLHIFIIVISSHSHRKHRKKYDTLTQISNTFQINRNESAALISTLFKKNKHSHIDNPLDYSNIRQINRGEPIDLFVCENYSSLPLWSWAISRSCCDVFPLRGEERIMEDPNYFLKQRITNGNIIYVYILDFPLFLSLTFLKLPTDIKVTIVTGMNRIGTPMELFDKSGRYKVKPTISLKEFLADSRLNKWYVQNYDLVDCVIFKDEFCSNITKSELLLFKSKIIPIPVGVDLHTHSHRGDMEKPEFKEKECHQRYHLDYLRNVSIPIKERPLSILSLLNCTKIYLKLEKEKELNKIKLLTVQNYELCHLLESNKETITVTNVIGDSLRDRNKFWNLTQQNSFVILPGERSLDNNKVWETIILGSIPIVLTSPLDQLYSEYPIAIVKSWSDVFKNIKGGGNYLQTIKDNVIKRFSSPFNNDVKKRLSLDYWVDKIRSNT